MRGPIACISHGSIVALNRRPYDLLATRHGLNLSVIVPDRWVADAPDPDIRAKPGAGGARLVPLRGLFTGDGTRFLLRGLGAELRAMAPGAVLLDEEPWSLVAWQALRSRVDAPLIVYSKQNIAKRLPPPFAQIRRAAYRRAVAAWAVGETTAATLRATGFQRPVHVVPHGAEVSRFLPGRDDVRRAELGLSGVVIGFVGRLVPEKGVRDLLAALTLLADRRVTGCSVCFVGGGPLAHELERAGREGVLAGRVRLVGPVVHDDAPRQYQLFDVLALPSRTTPRWREQFGRVLVEAAATGLPLVGSDSGEIPHVLRSLAGTAVVPEGDVTALADALEAYIVSAERRRDDGQRNLEAARRLFSHEAVADRMFALLGEVA